MPTKEVSAGDKPRDKYEVDDVNFEDLKATNLEELPLFAKTGIIEPTVLNSRRINIRVTEGSLKSGGIFSASYIVYKISVDPLDWTIHRKEADFYVLRKHIVKMFPYKIVPPMPPKKKKEGDRFMRRREKFLTRFLQALCRCDEFKSDPFFVEWLKNDDVKAFEKLKKDIEKQKFLRNMMNVRSL